jgi:hypothetical protein
MRLYIKHARRTYNNLQVIKHGAMCRETSPELSMLLVIQNLQIHETALERLNVQSINCLRDHEITGFLSENPRTSGQGLQQ